MPSKNQKKRKERAITLAHAAYILRVPESQMEMWHREGRFTLQQTPYGKLAILEDDLKKLAYSKDCLDSTIEALLQLARRRENDEKTERNQFYADAIDRHVERYCNHIETLIDIHSSYHGGLDLLRDQTATVAAYILYSKVIRLLRLTCISLQHHYWDALALSRLSSEAGELALYFIVSEGTPKGQESLQRWFRENHSPKNQTCREAIGSYIDLLPGKDARDRPHEEVMGDLYYQQSKEIHHTHHGIMETYRAKIGERGNLIGQGLDYGPCSDLCKMLEITEHFQDSGLIPAVHRFLLCFKERLPLTQDHLQRLMDLNRVLM